MFAHLVTAGPFPQQPQLLYLSNTILLNKPTMFYESERGHLTKPLMTTSLPLFRSTRIQFPFKTSSSTCPAILNDCPRIPPVPLFVRPFRMEPLGVYHPSSFLPPKYNTFHFSAHPPILPADLHLLEISYMHLAF